MCLSFIFINRIKELAPGLLYFAVYDGHGGSFCAEFCNQKIEDVLLSELKKGETNLQAVLESSFSRTNSLFSQAVASLPEDKKEIKNSGTTATVCLLKDNKQLVIAHVGDSQALLCRNGDYQKLTIDHNSQLKSEKVSQLLFLCHFPLSIYLHVKRKLHILITLDEVL
jgi:protein phosphatase 1K, mitochondrial